MESVVVDGRGVLVELVVSSSSLPTYDLHTQHCVFALTLPKLT